MTTKYEEISQALRAATAAIKAVTTPLPSSFEKSEAGLMTLDEFLRYKNPQGKVHPESAYNYEVIDLNETLSGIGSLKTRMGEWTLLGPYLRGDGQVLKLDGKVVAVLHRGTLFTNLRTTQVPLIPEVMFSGPGKEVSLDEIKQVKRVKYPEDYIVKISNAAERNRKRFDHLINNIIIDGEPMQIRSEGRPVKNKQHTIAILNQNGEEVAFVADEWGASLLAVTREYQRKGLGDILLKLWYKYNPDFTSGGTTPAGARANARLWENRVREFIANGWYSELVKQKKLTLERAKEIMADLSPSVHRLSRLPEKPKVKEKARLLLYVDDLKQPVSFVLYDARFLSDPEGEKAEDYIYAYGFFRDSEHAPAPFLYRLDYERNYADLANSIAMQMARQNNDKVWVGETYSDVLEGLDSVPGLKREGDIVWLERDVVPLRQLSMKERSVRKPLDRYGELETLLLETAEGKWS